MTKDFYKLARFYNQNAQQSSLLQCLKLLLVKTIQCVLKDWLTVLGHVANVEFYKLSGSSAFSCLGFLAHQSTCPILVWHLAKTKKDFATLGCRRVAVTNFPTRPILWNHYNFELRNISFWCKMLTLAFRIDSFDFEFFPCIGEIKVGKNECSWTS